MTLEEALEVGSMLAKRIIPCLDVKDGRVVKGINFVDFAMPEIPSNAVFDIPTKAPTNWSFWILRHHPIDATSSRIWCRRVADAINIPFTVGGGLRSLDDIQQILRAGADKVSLNTSAVEDPYLIRRRRRTIRQPVHRCRHRFADAKAMGAHVYTHGGRTRTNLDTVEWAKSVAELGAGEILLTSMDADGTKVGYDLS